MALSGIAAIDDLLNGGGAPILTGSTDRDAVGLVQDLLSCQGVAGMPGLTSPNRGSFGPVTTKAIRKFQKDQGLPALPAGDETVATVDADTLGALVGRPAANPLACGGYLSLVLDFPLTGMLRVLSFTTIFEGAGKFSAQNRNTDGAGLSYGLIQWAQKPKRLNELLRAFQAQQPGRFVQILGGGSASVAQGLVNHTARQRGGLDDAGVTTDPSFNLVKEPWTTRFRQAALDPGLQRVQVSTALTAFGTSFQRVQVFAPQIKSERGVAFMLDLANQHGDGGAKSIFQTVAGPGMTEAQLLLAVENESVRRVAAQHGANSVEAKATRTRREDFRTSPLLSDQPFDPA